VDKSVIVDSLEISISICLLPSSFCEADRITI
jgi:hypothetical protein